MHVVLVALVAGALVGGGMVFRPPRTAALDQVERGKEIYQTRCALCHGEKGEGRVGRALIGPTAGLGGYGTARGLFDYVKSVMPADDPGRLLDSEYWAVLAYILEQNGLLARGATLDRSNAANVRLAD